MRATMGVLRKGSRLRPFIPQIPDVMNMKSFSHPAGIASILHPSDFTPESDTAFAHALKIALVTRAELSLLHGIGDEEDHWENFPGVRATLERWGLMPAGSPRHDVAKLGIAIHKLLAHGRDPLQAVRHYVADHPFDLIVLATHPHEGRMRWPRASAAEPIARDAHEAALFIPGDAKGFVARADGSISLRNVLVPVAATPWPERAVTAAYRLAYALGAGDAMFHLLHVGAASGMPDVAPDGEAGRQWPQIVRSGQVVETILEVADEISADMIAMTTDGHHGFLDALRGSTTERVLREAGRPLLAVPVVPFDA